VSTLRPVAELDLTEEAPWWPVTADAGWRRAVLDGALPLGEIGAFMQQLAEQCRPEEVGSGGAEVPAGEAVRWITDADELSICGGLRADDDAGTRIDPGCCCDLDGWREWAGFGERPTLWLGHDPDPWIEYRDTGIRLHPRGGMGERRPSETGFLEFSHTELRGALRSAQRDLLGFLDAVGRWARGAVPDRAAELVLALDRQIGISAPLW
jgi:hypothetical protein